MLGEQRGFGLGEAAILELAAVSSRRRRHPDRCATMTCSWNSKDKKVFSKEETRGDRISSRCDSFRRRSKVNQPRASSTVSNPPDKWCSSTRYEGTGAFSSAASNPRKKSRDRKEALVNLSLVRRPRRKKILARPTSPDESF